MSADRVSSQSDEPRVALPQRHSERGKSTTKGTIPALRVPSVPGNDAHVHCSEFSRGISAVRRRTESPGDLYCPLFRLFSNRPLERDRREVLRQLASALSPHWVSRFAVYGVPLSWATSPSVDCRAALPQRSAGASRQNASRRGFVLILPGRLLHSQDSRNCVQSRACLPATATVASVRVCRPYVIPLKPHWAAISTPGGAFS